MDFLESSAVLVPVLTGMALTIYHGEPDALCGFECRYCFSPQLQTIYTAQGLQTFFQKGAEDRIYDVSEPMGTRLAALKAGGQWLLLGPYVETGWSVQAARLLLAGQGASEAALPMYKAYRCKLPIVRQELAVRTAFVLAENMGSGARTVENIRMGAEGKNAVLTFSERYADAEEVNCRYQLEDRLVEAVSEGDAGKAHRAWRENNKFLSGLRFMSDSRQDQLAGAAIMRTLLRMGAKKGGLSPVLIDSISQEYAQRMKHACSREELEGLIVEMNGRMCEEVRERRRTGLSPAVRRALDYMEINLSKPMTTDEIARASGEKKRNFVCRFARETGMTVKAYLAAMRCNIAARLLADGDASIQEIAAYVGYTDNNYFSKVFRENFGMTPQAYRVSHKTSPVR